jgi:hypothetical protein
MKKLVITILFFAILGIYKTQAQINLVLNRVITKTTILGDSLRYPLQTSDTVPAGKVWKIDALYQEFRHSKYQSNGVFYSVNNPKSIHIGIPEKPYVPLSFWMQAGDIIYFRLDGNNGTTPPYLGILGTGDVFISILEFNTTK